MPWHTIPTMAQQKDYAAGLRLNMLTIRIPTLLSKEHTEQITCQKALLLSTPNWNVKLEFLSTQ